MALTLVRFIAPDWLIATGVVSVVEGMFSEEEITIFNQQGYNVYYFPNLNTKDEAQTTYVSGANFTQYQWVFVDFDLKHNAYVSKKAIVEKLNDLPPTQIVDSGNGVHAYWHISDLDAKSYLRLCKRLSKYFNSDPSVGTLAQLMRYPGTINTKMHTKLKKCDYILIEANSYTAEELDTFLPSISLEDEKACELHYDKTFNLNQVEIDSTLPSKFGDLIRSNKQVADIWAEPSDDRSRDDFRLGHIMFAKGFTKHEALSVLVNSAKALTRAPVHRASYASNIVDKIWTFEQTPEDNQDMSPTVRQILAKGDSTLTGTRFPCNKLVDDTVYGFRLGQCIGIIGGAGVGKTTMTLNMFLWFCENNPDYHHFFFSLEQPSGEIATRIRTICGANDTLYDKIHIVSNYNEKDGSYNHFSLTDIETHLLNFQTSTGSKVGAAVVDHIGVLDKQSKNGENDGLIGVCRQMKAVAIKVNIMLIMLSQAPREKAGVGDLELNKDAAYGTVFFESFVDYCICLWQPLKRMYSKGAPTIMAFKFAKIRHKKQTRDVIKEDVCYQVFFDPETERFREVTQIEEKSIVYWNAQATSARKADRKTDVVPYVSRKANEPVAGGPVDATEQQQEPNSNRRQTGH